MDDTSFSIRDYFKPKSVTWWSGVVAVALGGAMLLGYDTPTAGRLGETVAMLVGATASPASLISVGFGLIGIRAKLGRMP